MIKCIFGLQNINSWLAGDILWQMELSGMKSERREGDREGIKEQEGHSCCLHPLWDKGTNPRSQGSGHVSIVVGPMIIHLFT